jgi:hypothetical protein
MENWRTVWREGYSKCMDIDCLVALRDGLINDDIRLLQGATTKPPPLMCVMDWPVEGADAIGYAFWHGKYEGEATIGQIEEEFARAAFEADQRLGEPAACRWFLNWFDDTPREEMRRELLFEINNNISELQNVSNG